MNKLFLIVAFLMCIGLGSTDALSQVKIVRGEGIAVTQGSDGPSEDERTAAMKAAKLAAWRSYMAMPGQNETVDQIRANEKQFLERLDELIVDVITVDEGFNKDGRRYNIRIKATVAESVINSIIRDSSKVPVKGLDGGGSAGTPVGGTPILVLGMAREADVVKSFLEKRTNITQASGEIESSKGGGLATSTKKEVSGGNRERKRDEVSYKIGNVGILNNKLPRILLQNGIKASPYAFLMRPCRLPNPDNFSKQYASSEMGELPAKVMAEIQENLFACGRVKYWVFASMDVGGYGTDPNTGMNLATVTVNVQLMEVDTGAQLASASKDVSGRSADQGDAIKVATEGAVQAVGDIITAQVANLGR